MCLSDRPGPSHGDDLLLVLLVQDVAHRADRLCLGSMCRGSAPLFTGMTLTGDIEAFRQIIFA